MLRVIPNDKVEVARRYIENNLGPTELLALCESCYDFKNGLDYNKEKTVFKNTLVLLQLEDEPAALGIATYEAAHKTFGHLVQILIEDDVKRYFNYNVKRSRYEP